MKYPMPDDDGVIASDMGIVVAIQMDQMASEFNHMLVYGEFACPIRSPIGPWRCVACGIIRVDLDQLFSTDG